jgi:TatA/E family protein of Tat protein translocase
VFSTIFSGTNDLIVILVAFVVLFGGSQLPKLAHNTGEALREFRKAHSEAEESTASDGASPATRTPQSQIPQSQIPQSPSLPVEPPHDITGAPTGDEAAVTRP